MSEAASGINGSGRVLAVQFLSRQAAHSQNPAQRPLRSETDRIAARQRNDAMGQVRRFALRNLSTVDIAARDGLALIHRLGRFTNNDKRGPVFGVRPIGALNVSIIASSAFCSASAWESFGLAANAAKVSVISATALSESTAQLETTSERAPA
jgi:hypothetical protein